MVPTEPPPDRFPSSPDDLPEGKYLGDCPRCGEEHYAAYVSDVDSIETTPCGACQSDLCSECPQMWCDVGDHSVCRECIRVLRGADDPLNVCLKCAEPVLEEPLLEIVMFKRAISTALEAMAKATSIESMATAIITLTTALATSRKRGF